MAKLAEDDRIKQMNAQKRRMKQLGHKRAVDRLLEERQHQRTTDKVHIMKIFIRIICMYLLS